MGVLNHMIRRMIRQLLFGVALAVLVGPYDLFGWLSVGLFIIAFATIPTSQFVFYAFGTKILGMLAMTFLWGGIVVLAMLWIVDPIYRLDLSLWNRFAALAGVFLVLMLSGWAKLHKR